MLKWIVAIVCLAGLGFCLFGYLATFEPGVAGAVAFRVGYAVAGLVCLVGVAWPFIARKGGS